MIFGTNTTRDIRITISKYLSWYLCQIIAKHHYNHAITYTNKEEYKKKFPECSVLVRDIHNILVPFSYSHVYLSMNSLLYPSHGPLRSLTSHSCFALASMRNHAKNEAPEEEVVVLFAIVYRFKSCEYWDFEIFISGFITT